MEVHGSLQVHPIQKIMVNQGYEIYEVADHDGLHNCHVNLYYQTIQRCRNGIDKHLTLTLGRSGDRQRAVLGAATAMQTPIDKIFFVEGHDDKPYNGDMKAIAQAAADDGFGYAHQFATGISNKWTQQSASAVCQVWNYGRILRHIALGDQVCMVTWDDRVVTVPFPIVDAITSELQSRSEEFYMFQLRIRFGDSDIIELERLLKIHPELIHDPEGVCGTTN